MEGLILLLGEALFAFLAPLFGLATGVMSAVVSAVAEIALRLVPAMPSPRLAVPRKWVRRLSLATLAVGALLLIGLVLLETVFFRSAVQAAVDRIATRSGIRITYEKASGFLLGARVRLDGVTARRSGHDGGDFDLRIETLEVDARLWSLLRKEASFEFFRLKRVRGRYDRVAGVERGPRKPFAADAMEIADAEITWVLKRPDRPDFALPLRIDRLQSAPFDARNAAFSLLFRTTAFGAIAGAPFEIRSEGTGDGRKTAWRAQAVPVRLMADFLGEPFDWLSGGTADVHVDDEWRRGDRTFVDLHWRIVFKNLTAEVPPRISGFKRRVAEGVVGFVQRHPAELPLDFTLRLDEEGFRGRMSVETLGLWHAVARAAAEELAERAGLPPDVVREYARDGWGTFKEFLKKRAAQPR
ncbi:MAG TPA: hypothetical protein VEJ18_06430 [Planctomycetota bacterium]|nr:hypothetical protein [Planctomycetota bacterium]